MSIVILNALPMAGSDRTAGEKIETAVVEALQDTLADCASQLAVFQLEKMLIKPCNSCGACAFKSPGRCVVADDMHKIMYAMAPASHLVMITPVRFGGYSATLKKAVDKFALLALPGYASYKGTMVHPARYGRKSLLGIGVAEKLPEEKAASFKRMVAHNAHNMQTDYSALIISPNHSAAGIVQQVQAAVKGGLKA
jgi:multimeric flavodoxin WrbA